MTVRIDAGNKLLDLVDAGPLDRDELLYHSLNCWLSSEYNDLRINCLRDAIARAKQEGLFS